MSDTLSAVTQNARPRRAQPALFVGLVADSPALPPARIGLGGLDRVELRRSDARRVRFERTNNEDLVVLELADARLSQRHARLRRVGATWLFDDLDSKNGSWLKGRRIKTTQLADGDVIVVGHTALVFRAVGGEAPNQTAEPSALAAGLQTLSPPLEAKFADLAVAARSPVSIEITGETGTGKELVARAVHALSGRPGGFVAVNCGAIASTLLEAELFGHRKGAYTGATDERAGLIRSADGGTLFLDEIAELPPASQASLLRVLQEGEVVPVGADRAVPVDVRVVTATHQDLDGAVAAGRFRADLRARVLGFQIKLPALRDRPEDLGVLVAALLARSGRAQPPVLSIEAMTALYAYRWPLNIRELERALAAATAVARDRIELTHLPLALRAAAAASEGDDDPSLPRGAATAAPVASAPAAPLSPADVELRDRLAASIAKHAGNLAEVARELGKDRTQIRRWMKRFGISR